MKYSSFQTNICFLDWKKIYQKHKTLDCVLQKILQKIENVHNLEKVSKALTSKKIYSWKQKDIKLL